MKITTKIQIFLISLFIAACSSIQLHSSDSGSKRGSRHHPKKNVASKEAEPTEEKTNTGRTSSGKAVNFSQKFGYSVSPKANIDLLRMVDDWLGSPYLYAGSSKKGTDCSGFVQQVYLKIYQKTPHRTADGMYDQSQKVSQKNLKEGDMVFFKINTPKVGHVGLYLQDGYFAHASTARGVVISNLSEDYYARYFVGGGRL